MGQNFRILARKSVFCYRTPDFVNGPFVALAKAVDLAPSDPFFNFSFPSYGNFREGDPSTQQKVLPHLIVVVVVVINLFSELSITFSEKGSVQNVQYNWTLNRAHRELLAEHSELVDSNK